jgi:hypothetical protein
VRWVSMPENHDALANQWFLVAETPEPIAFVGFETSPSGRIGEGGAADPSRTWAGFVTDDRRLVGAIAGYLQGVVDRGAPPAVDGHEAARSTMLLVATDDGVDPAYAACRRAGFELARRKGAAVVLYDRSSESYLVDPYPYGVWTSEYLGPAGDKLRDINELIPLGRHYLADQVAEGRALGLQVGPGWPGALVRPPWPPRASASRWGGPSSRTNGPPAAERSHPGPHAGRLPGPRAGGNHPRGR